MENWKTGLRPQRSPSLPSTSVVTALVSRYAVAIHGAPAASCRLRPIDATAVETTVASRLLMNRTSISGTITRAMPRFARCSRCVSETDAAAMLSPPFTRFAKFDLASFAR
jgi:hypothetical protein